MYLSDTSDGSRRLGTDNRLTNTSLKHVALAHRLQSPKLRLYQDALKRVHRVIGGVHERGLLGECV